MQEHTNIYLTILLISVCVVAYVVCMMATIALLNSRLRKLLPESGEKKFASGVAAKVLEQAEVHMVAVQIGMFLAPFFAGFFFLEAMDVIAASFSGVANHPVYLALISLLLIAVVSTTVITVQLARSLAYGRPEFVLRVISIPLFALGFFFKPPVRILRWVIKKLLRALGLKTVIEQGFTVSAEDLSEILDHSTEAGKIEEEERTMIEGVFEMSGTLVREVMTPRADVIFVLESVGREEIIAIFKEHGFSRMPVTSGELDNVIGIVLAKDLLFLLDSKGAEFSVKDIMRPIHSIYGDTKVDEALKEFQREATQFAVVLDEHGGVDGIVTFEDLVEEIVGEVFDEHDVPDDEVEFKETLSGDILVDGSMSIDDLNEEYEFDFPEGEYDTVAGFAIHSLGRLPEVGESLKCNGLLLTVEEVNQNRVLQIRISLPEKKQSLELN